MNASKITPALAPAAFVLAVVALVVAVIGIARPIPDAQAEGWTCTTDVIRIAPVKPGLEREAEKVASAVAYAAVGTPLRVEIVAQGAEADLLVDDTIVHGYVSITNSHDIQWGGQNEPPTVRMGALGGGGDLATRLQGWLPCEPTLGQEG